MFAIIVDGNITSDACVGREAGRALFPRTKVVLVCWQYYIQQSIGFIFQVLQLCNRN